MSNKKDRHQFILHELDVNNRILLTDVSTALNVSTDTIRRDIKELHDQKKLNKVHGGATSINLNNLTSSLSNIYAVQNKLVIARKAIALIEDDSVILISGGTTNLELIKSLPHELQCTFFTPSLPIALALSSHPAAEVIFIGGRISKASQITVGGSALNVLSDIKVDLCFMGTGYLDPVSGMTEFDWEVVQMKKAMMSASKRVISLSISEKLNSMRRYKICDIQAIDTLITELEPESAALDAYRNQGINIL